MFSCNAIGALGGFGVAVSFICVFASAGIVFACTTSGNGNGKAENQGRH
jgi:hypothetical protein